MKICLFIDNFTPDLGASSFRFESIVKELADRNHEVTIIASYPNRIKLEEFKEFKYKNVNIIRINKSDLKNNIFQRAIKYFGYFLEAIREGKRYSKDCDIIIATSPQLLVGVAGAFISKINNKIFLLDIRDLWPDIVLDMNVMKKYNPIYLFLKLLEKFMYRKSTFLVYNSPGFFKYLEKNYNVKRMELITNGIDDYILDYFESKALNLTKKEKYKILYAGNLGIAQDIKILIELAKYRKDIEIILIGKGSQEKEIKSKMKNVNNITLTSSVPRNELLKIYEESDILFVQLKNIKMFEKTIPSKIFEYLASKKPIIFGLEGVARNILENEFSQQYYFESNNIEKLNKVLDKVIYDIENNSYIKPDTDKLRKKYSRKNLSIKYANLIEKVIEDDK
ncbi:glycosyltransferase family 4 protein [Fusobacterium perfoetens]|uniref:glycosyltransferase family 4 protein n=1 Tax=Fusobacterium perfoetens TaxID=852 RepID=UPI000488B06E|nr:glycosyltransferase family 4 protein [Fusobacterium perfoetens]